MKASLTNFTVKELPDCMIIGKEIRVFFVEGEENPIPAFWGKCFSDGTIASLEKHPDRIFPQVLVGWCGDFNTLEKSFTYIIGVFVKPAAEVPEDMNFVTLPAGKYATGTIEGQEPDIYFHAHDLAIEEVKKAEMEHDPQRGCEMEWYDERFCRDDDKRVIDLLIPIR